MAGPTPKTNTYDAVGNLLSDGSATFSYNNAGRMKTVSVRRQHLDLHL